VGGFGLALATFFAYELDIFSTSGGVVFISLYATLVGLFAAFVAGYMRQGLLVGWLFAASTLFGWQAEWATGISPRPLVERVVSVVEPSGLASLAMLTSVLAVVRISAGAVVRWSVETSRVGRRSTADS
jgi:hypothetical protein